MEEYFVNPQGQHVKLLPNGQIRIIITGKIVDNPGDLIPWESTVKEDQHERTGAEGFMNTQRKRNGWT